MFFSGSSVTFADDDLPITSSIPNKKVELFQIPRQVEGAWAVFIGTLQPHVCCTAAGCRHEESDINYVVGKVNEKATGIMCIKRRSLLLAQQPDLTGHLIVIHLFCVD